jgi:leucyl-tRNA synthetase
MSYNFLEIEQKWQKYWEGNKTFATYNDTSKPKYYILDMFPYPSGAGLHIGHPEGYTATDIIARYKRMKGFNVLHPMGFDAFGLPTERYSMQTGIHPELATETNINNFIRQLKLIGLGYDWDRIINTTSPSYYKWTQYMFLLIYNSWYNKDLDQARPIDELPIPQELTEQKDIDEYIDSKRLAYISMMPVNWCEELGTVLANEEVEEWKSKGYSVIRKPMRQWMIKITEYSQRLLEDLNLVEWPSSTLEMQKHWIGKSEGATINFQVKDNNRQVEVFTTRPDTIFGATYLVLAPEHDLVKDITTPQQFEKVAKYIETTQTKSDIERQEQNREKTGVFTGSYAINPANSAEIPILISDYVLVNYGTGAIMAVPGHDTRDFEFAKALDMKIIQVVSPDGKEQDELREAFTDYGISINSESCDLALDGKNTEEAKNTVITWLESTKIGKRKVQYRLRDWLFSRQRYWGEPMPIMFYEDGSKRHLNEDELPLVLPKDITDFKPAGTGESPLANVETWVDFLDPYTNKKARFETNTMPQWAGSCWYYLRYIDPTNEDAFCDEDLEKYWMGETGVDLYVGGAEHAVLHLLYARFWHKVLYDYGLVSQKEPFKKLFHQGLIIGEDGRKMSKSLGNVVNPDDIIAEYGADSLRLYEMFLGPLEAAKPWSSKGIEGVHRFLQRVWRMCLNENGEVNSSVKDITLNEDMEYILHSTIKKVQEDIENLSFNTAISQMMIFVNECYKQEQLPKSLILEFLKVLSPFAPHLVEEIWHKFGNENSISLENFPEFDEAKTVRQTIEFVVQVNSKIRSRLTVKLDLEQKDIEEIASKDETVHKFINGAIPKKIIFVKNKLINFIV